MQPLDLQERTVPHLKDLINVCLENESQDHGMSVMCVILTQTTPISYYTEAFVKTEVASTVLIYNIAGNLPYSLYHQRSCNSPLD